LGENFMVAALGSVLGAVLTMALLVLGALVFLPKGIFPDILSTTVEAGTLPFGRKAVILALCGMLATLSGAAIETGLSGGYNLCQFFHLAWGKNRPAKSVPKFTATWVGMFFLMRPPRQKRPSRACETVAGVERAQSRASRSGLYVSGSST